MSVGLDHTIVWSTAPAEAAAFLADMLDLPEPTRFGRFHVVKLGNGVSMDFAERPGPIARQHYAFLVDDAVFDRALGLIREGGLAHWADPMRSRPNEINTLWGGRGVYFDDPDGHSLEIITATYGALEEAGHGQ